MLLEQNLAKRLEALEIDKNEKVSNVYNPIAYAEETHLAFLKKFMNGKKKILFLGMNPGPWGMAQTGVPFGEVGMVKEFLKIHGNVDKPKNEHPKRPILGLKCTRREISGERLWTLFKEVCGSPEKFFESCAIYNHCPLLFLAESGKNLTPVDLPIGLRKKIIAECDETLAKVINLLEVEHVVGIGRFAEQRAEIVVKEHDLGSIKISFMSHPSPASASSNKEGWSTIANRQLKELNLLPLLQTK